MLLETKLRVFMDPPPDAYQPIVELGLPGRVQEAPCQRTQLQPGTTLQITCDITNKRQNQNRAAEPVHDEVES